MTPERWRQVEEMLHAALSRGESERAAFLQQACAGDVALRREVELLLAQQASMGGFLEDQPVATAAPLVIAPAASVLSGRRLGAYQVHERIGVGGMGEVYRARDTRLGRDVAIKILPRHFTSDPDRLARFEREARVLASLNHPHIGAIYGVEDADGVRALVLELVDGETLAERIQRGRLPIPEALHHARQIAEALDAAHEKGIIHRDLKPANIKITATGTVKVLDFGLAKAVSGDEAGDLHSNAPTMTIGDTREGFIIGTAPYMSPEQARGQTVDKRADTWAFGCVLYEMLAGQAAFARETVTDTLAAVVTDEPNWAMLPSNISTDVQQILRRCLTKDPTRRLRDMGDVRLQLEETAANDSPALQKDPRPWLALSLGLIAVVTAGVTLLWWASKSGGIPSSAVTRTTIALAANQELDAIQTTSPLAVSPDGRQLAYVARSGGRASLYLRTLDAFDGNALTGTEGARYPFFSPDGRWIAFFADGKLKRVSTTEGAPVTICDVPVPGRGGTWGPDGNIVFDPGTGGLMRVAAMGGDPEPLISRDSAMDARNLSWPEFLPNGRAILATVTGLESPGEHLAVLSLESSEWHVLGQGSQARFLPSGHLVYHAANVREGELHAVAFDADTLTFRGAPVAVLDGVFRSANGGAAFFVISRTGTLLFAPGGFGRTLVQVDRRGRRTALTDDRLGFRFPRVSPDGRKVAVTIDPRPSQIWVYDIEQGGRIPLATAGHNLTPVWTPDGQRVAFSCRRVLCWRPADGSREEEQLLNREHQNVNATSWSADGRLLIFQEEVPASRYDIWVAPRGEEPRRLVSTPGNDIGGKLSPDTRWLAYYSDESGREEVYVRPFPDVNAQKWTVSTAGGWSPVWSPDGRELFYMNGGAMMAVAVEVQGTRFVTGKPQFLFDGPFDSTQDMNFDISPDGKYFVMVESDPDARPTRVNVVLNWHEELKRLVPAD